jgi:polysaccharide pyruvyl transferase CsaB
MRILICGYYGMGNHGDEALLAGLLQLLHSGGHHVTVLSGNPAETRQLHGVNAVHRYRGLPAALISADAVIAGGGGLLQDSTSSRSLSYYLTVINLAKLLKRKVLVYGQSLGPLSAAGRNRVRSALGGVALAVRDTQSQQLLAELGFSSTLVADPALLLLPDSPGNDPVTDLLLIPRASYPDLTAALVAAGQAAGDAGQRLGLLALHGEQDQGELAVLQQALPQARVFEAGTFQDSLNVIAAADFVLSARLHGLILAAAAGRSYAGLVYDPKVRGFLEQAGAPVFERPVEVGRLVPLALARPPQPEASRERLVAAAAAGGAWLARELASG